jgi:hypothetical protein
MAAGELVKGDPDLNNVNTGRKKLKSPLKIMDFLASSQLSYLASSPSRYSLATWTVSLIIEGVKSQSFMFSLAIIRIISASDIFFTGISILSISSSLWVILVIGRPYFLNQTIGVPI